MILPVAALSFPIAGEYTRYVRSSLLDTLGQDYVLTAYSKGLRLRTVLLRHALRNSLIPLVTILALQLPWMVSGLVVTESIFTWPGMGRLLWTAALQHDYPMMMADHRAGGGRCAELQPAGGYCLRPPGSQDRL